jgi:methyl-accepting chemotaxis protein
MNPLNLPAALMARLTYARKFALLGLVLLAPAAFALHAYWKVQGDTLAFADSERVGVRYLAPANELSLRVIAARSLAVRASTGDADAGAALPKALDDVKTAVAAVDAADKADGGAINMTKAWQDARETILAGEDAKSLDAAAAAAVGLIVSVGDGSKLILDPDLDSYYVMDTLITKLPAMADNTGRAGDLQAVVTAKDTLDQRIALAGAQGALRATTAAMASGLQTAFKNTADAGLKPALSGGLTAASGAAEHVAAGVDPTGSGKVATDNVARGEAALAAIAALQKGASPRLDALLVARMDKFSAARNRVALIVVLGAVIAVFLFLGFFVSTRRTVAEISERLTGLRDHESRDLSDALDALAGGDLTVEIAPQTQPIATISRDELGQIAVAANGILESTQASIDGYNRMRGELAALIGTVSANAGTVSAASQQMVASSEDTGRAVGDIVRAVNEVASGAERQVRLVESTRTAVDEAARAAASSAGIAVATNEAAESARRAAADGARTAEDATESIRRIADSSAAVGSAMDEFSARSRKIGGIVETITAIAEQTNLLALNAAIEAARAGEAGRGFAVVAEEVRGLAEESRAAAAQITDIVEAIQVETSHVVEAVAEGHRHTEHGVATVAQSRRAFEDIGATVEEMASRVSDISAAVEQIAAEAERASSEVSDVAAVAEQSSAAAQEVSASTTQTGDSASEIATSAQGLAVTAAELNELVGRFVLTR